MCGELGINTGPAQWGTQQTTSPQTLRAEGRQLALAAMADLGVFFAVILLGFAYVWRQGDLNWVRATGGQGVAGRNEANWKVVST